MKFRHNKIKKEHSIIEGALDWLEDLSKIREITDIIPGVIDITHSKERGVFFQYETSTGCKIMLKSGGAIQEAFVVTKNPVVVQAWIAKNASELELLQSALIFDEPRKDKNKEPQSKVNQKSNPKPKDKLLQTGITIGKRDDLLEGIKEEYKLVEIDQGLRDSFVDSLATMADLEDPKIEDTLDFETLEVLRKLGRG